MNVPKPPLAAGAGVEEVAANADSRGWLNAAEEKAEVAGGGAPKADGVGCGAANADCPNALGCVGAAAANDDGWLAKALKAFTPGDDEGVVVAKAEVRGAPKPV